MPKPVTEQFQSLADITEDVLNTISNNSQIGTGLFDKGSMGIET